MNRHTWQVFFSDMFKWFKLIYNFKMKDEINNSWESMLEYKQRNQCVWFPFLKQFIQCKTKIYSKHNIQQMLFYVALSVY